MVAKQLADKHPNFFTCWGMFCTVLHSFPTETQIPILVIGLITHPIITLFPSPHFPADISCDHLPYKLPTLNYLSQSLLLGKPKLAAGHQTFEILEMISQCNVNLHFSRTWSWSYFHTSELCLFLLLWTDGHIFCLLVSSISIKSVGRLSLCL